MIQVLYLTRFSYFGASGWQSDFSQSPDALLDEERLEARFKLFDTITLPSLAAQTDGDFKHLVLSSTRFSDATKKRLRDMVADHLGAERARVIFRNKGSAGEMFRAWIHRCVDADMLVAQSVLDDDDALAPDFTSILRAEATLCASLCHDDEDAQYLSFPRGLSLVMNAGAPFLARRIVPFTNLGLTLVAPASSDKNPFMLSHKRVMRRHAARMIATLRPLYIRTIHGLNDSKGRFEEKRLSPEETEDARRTFPFLAPILDGKLDLAAD